MILVRPRYPDDLIAPVVVAAFDGWVDAGSASTTAADVLAEDGEPLARFDADLLYDYRARRPSLEIIDGQPGELHWPELSLRRSRWGDRDLLVLTGPEPDFRWQELADELTTLARRYEVEQWISLGSIPAAVPHTRAVPILGTESEPGLLRAGVKPGPSGVLKVPAAAISMLDHAAAQAGIPAIGYFAQIPHYISGSYTEAAVTLLHTLEQHLGIRIPVRPLVEEADELRVRLNAAAAVDETTRTYVERLEAMVDESRLPSGDELISEIERFLRDRGTESSSNPLQ